LGARDTVTVAVELLVKNALLGIVLVNQTLDFEAVIPVFAFSLFRTPMAVLLLFGWRLLARNGYLANESGLPDEAAREESP